MVPKNELSTSAKGNHFNLHRSGEASCLTYNTLVSASQKDICFFCSGISLLTHSVCDPFPRSFFWALIPHQIVSILYLGVYFFFSKCSILCLSSLNLIFFFYFKPRVHIIKIILNAKPVLQEVCSLSQLTFLCILYKWHSYSII